LSNAELAQQYFDAWNAGDLATIRELVDPGIELVFPRGTFGLNDVVEFEWFKNPERGPEHLEVSFVDRTLEEDGATVVSTVTRVDRWKETGEIASTMRVKATLTCRGGKIVKVELAPPETIPDE
jgi:ketosteroid isomerase-like protein